ncbi:MAG: hypothetical protein ABIP74_02520, partial [Candidatus Saccharimonas sp.]
MNYFEVAPLRVVRGVQHTYTYQSTDELSVGQLVVIPLGKQSCVGLVVTVVTKPQYDTRQILESLIVAPLPEPL